jgi:hypothetical protein
MKTSFQSLSDAMPLFPPFDLARLIKTVFDPKKGERVCILIDLEDPADIKQLEFLNHPELPVQKRAYEIFYRGIHDDLMPKMQLGACDLYAYEMTGGSNLELPETVTAVNGKTLKFDPHIYSKYDIIMCIGTYSATAPLTAAAKRFGFRGATMHGLNDAILRTGLAVDYTTVSKEAERLRQGMTKADFVEIDFEVDKKDYHLHIDLGKQEAQKSHGICREGRDIANLPAGEVYFVPADAAGNFPIKFEEDGTLALMQVEKGKVKNITLIRGNQKTVDKYQNKFQSDPAASIIGELGFGTQVLPYSGADIQDEKIFGTFHLATGRNDHLLGSVTKERFSNLKNATHDDILFSSTKTPEIHVKQVRMSRNGKTELLIENYHPLPYLWNLRSNEKA